MAVYNYICKNKDCKKKFGLECNASELDKKKPVKCDECGCKVDMDLENFRYSKIGVIWKTSGAYGKSN